MSSNTTKSKTSEKNTRKIVINCQPDIRILIGNCNSYTILSGHTNIGAICYMIAVIQFINQLLDTKYSHSKSSRITQGLSKLILDMNRALCVVSPTSFWKAFTEKIKLFKSRKPHDASEFSVALLRNSKIKCFGTNSVIRGHRNFLSIHASRSSDLLLRHVPIL